MSFTADCGIQNALGDRLELVMLLKTYLRTIGSRSLAEYKPTRRYILGLVGFVKGLFLYYKNKRTVKIDAYVNYFMVRQITGDKNL